MTDRLLTEIERQQKYLDRLPENFEFPLFNARQALESQRRSGYRNTAAAAREIVDNAIEAGAKRINIIFERPKQLKAHQRQESISAIAFIDNGSGAYTSDTGAFSHCTANMSGTSLIVSIHRKFGWVLGFRSKRRLMEGDNRVPVRFRIDKGPWRKANGLATKTDYLSVLMPDEESLIKLFRYGRALYFNDYHHDYYYPLSGTDQLIQDLASCVRYHVAAEARGETPSPETAPPSQPESEETKSATSGTGIIISAGGKIVTNNHVVDECQKLIVQRSGELPVSAYVLSKDTSNDLALLQSDLRMSDFDVAPINVGRPIRAGESVAVYGFPLAGTLSSTGNVVAGNITALTGLGDDIRFFQISAPIQPGNSGGPLLDDYGKVVGIVNHKLDEIKWLREKGDLPQNVNFAIKASVLTSFLEAHSADYKNTESSDKLDLPAIAERAQKFRAFVLCAP